MVRQDFENFLLLLYQIRVVGKLQFQQNKQLDYSVIELAAIFLSLAGTVKDGGSMIFFDFVFMNFVRPCFYVFVVLHKYLVKEKLFHY